MTTARKAKQVRLHSGSRYKLMKHLEENKDLYTNRGYTYEQVAQKIGQQLGFLISPSSIQTALSDLGIVFTSKKKKLNREIVIIDSLIKLYDLFGVAPPDELVALTSSNSKVESNVNVEKTFAKE
jgi:hypothetical protein